MTDPCALVEPVIAVAREAARRILEVYAEDFEVRSKADSSPVTAADIAADDAIRAGLAGLAGGLPVLSEERAPPPFAERKGWERFWLVDPLDGTRGFVRRSGEFVVSIALIEHHRPVLGVVHSPVEGRAYAAARGAGAVCVTERGDRHRLRARRRPDRRPVVVASRSRRDPDTDAFVASVGEVELVRLGSALKSCLIAEGRADVYPAFGETSEWDTAGAQCVVEEAGGGMVDADGRALRYNTRDSQVNPRFVVFGDPRGDWMRHVPARLRTPSPAAPTTG